MKLHLEVAKSSQSFSRYQYEPPARGSSPLAASIAEEVASSLLTGSRPPGTGESTTMKFRAPGIDTYISARTSSPSRIVKGSLINTHFPSRSTLYSWRMSMPEFIEVLG